MFANSGEVDTVIFDTDVVIWAARGYPKAAQALTSTAVRRISVITYMELIEGVQDKRSLAVMQKFLKLAQLKILPLSAEIGSLAAEILVKHHLATSTGLADALIASTAILGDDVLCTGNAKHYRALPGLRLKIYRHA